MVPPFPLQGFGCHLYSPAEHYTCGRACRQQVLQRSLHNTRRTALHNARVMSSAGSATLVHVGLRGWHGVCGSVARSRRRSRDPDSKLCVAADCKKADGGPFRHLLPQGPASNVERGPLCLLLHPHSVIPGCQRRGRHCDESGVVVAVWSSSAFTTRSSRKKSLRSGASGATS